MAPDHSLLKRIWLFLAAAALAGGAAAVGCTAAEEEIEQASTPTPWHSPGAPTSHPCVIGLTPIPASEQLPVTASDIQQGSDGAYFVPDRGDCCPFQETMRQDFGDGEWVLLGNSSCDLYWRYSPSTGEVAGVPVITPDDLPTATPSSYRGPTPTPAPLAVTPKPGRTQNVWGKDIELGSDGRYSRMDMSDGCGEYREGTRLADGTGEWVYLQSPTCEPDVLFSPASGETRYLLPDFRLGPDGRFLRVDAGNEWCNYREVSRYTEEGLLWIRLESPTYCREAILYAPTAAEQRMVPPPSPTPNPTVPRLDKPLPSDIKMGADGKYYIPDRGDGCPWTEWQRSVRTDGRTKVVLTTVCEDGIALWYVPETGEMTFVVS